MAIAGHRSEHIVRKTPHLRVGFFWLRQRVFIQIVDLISIALDFIGNEFEFSL